MGIKTSTTYKVLVRVKIRMKRSNYNICNNCLQIIYSQGKALCKCYTYILFFFFLKEPFKICSPTDRQHQQVKTTGVSPQIIHSQGVIKLNKWESLWSIFWTISASQCKQVLSLCSLTISEGKAQLGKTKQKNLWWGVLKSGAITKRQTWEKPQSTLPDRGAKTSHPEMWVFLLAC